jgi:ATP-binding cassette, subfamily B (MDR/TAP), member 1
MPCILPTLGKDLAKESNQESRDAAPKSEPPSLKHLYAFTTRQHGISLIGGITSAFLVGALRTALAVLLGRIFSAFAAFGSGAVTGPDAYAQVSRWCAVLVIMGVVACVANFAFMALWVSFGEQQVRTIRMKLFRNLMDKDMSWFDAQEDGVNSLLVGIQTCALYPNCTA